MAVAADAARKRRFLETYAQCGDLCQSAAAVRVNRRTPYRWRDADPEFAQAFAEARNSIADDIEAVAIKRAKDGSDTLVIFLLKSLRPEVYRETIRLDVFAEARRLAAEYNLSEEDAVAEAERITRLHA